MSLLLVVRDPEKLLESCRTFIKMLHFEKSDLTGMALSDGEQLLGIWIDPTANILNTPDNFKVERDEYNSTFLLHGCHIVDSFSLSGVWAVCRLAFIPAMTWNSSSKEKLCLNHSFVIGNQFQC